MSDHTPLPWRIDEQAGDIWTADANSQPIVSLIWPDRNYVSDESIDADRAFIVKAANAHDDLVAFAEKFLNDKEATIQELDAMARAALAKAEARN